MIQASRQPAAFWCAAIFSVLILALGLYAAVTTARTVIRTYSPIIYWDQWEVVNNVMESGGKLTLGQLWAQHNEHRIPVGRIACYADLRLFGARNVSLLAEIYLVQVCAALLFIWLSHRFGEFRGPAFWTAAGFFVFCMLSPVQMENFTWGFQIAFVFAGFAAACSFAAFLHHATGTGAGAGRWISGPLLLAYGAAFLSECSLASGLLVWPMLILLGWTMRFPKRTQALTAGIGAIAAGAYFRGFFSPPQHAKPWVSIRHPRIVVQYVLTYFSTSWRSPLPPIFRWHKITIWMAGIAIVLMLCSAVWFLCRRAAAPDRWRTLLVGNGLFCILTALITALGRVNFGIGQATSGRYQVIALAFWASLAVLILTFVERLPRLALVAAQVGLLGLMLVSARRFAALEASAAEHQRQLAQGYAALAYAPHDDAAIAALYPAPDRVRVWYAYLQSHHLGPDAKEFAGYLPVPPSAQAPAAAQRRP